MAVLASARSTGEHGSTLEELSWDAEGTLNPAAGRPASPGAAAGAPGGPGAGDRGAVLRQPQGSARPSGPRDSRLPSRAQWARGGTGLRAPPPTGPDSARRARARALCIKPSSPAKVEEVGLPPGREAGGSPAPVVFREREWVAGAEGGVRPPTPGRALRGQDRAGSPAQLPAPDFGLSPSILPGGCGKRSYSVVPRTREERSVPRGPGP
ncbi:collagen alpha-1(I) chain-like [Herpailurus yagouaroundi]|uniref:collagen alpha-1(I) chain-like n=1 Tax=Herpailurus yagouaroundi TaxID=1608482 RepID=UPI001AD65038|nr:collagen alpha-1(I) chain-like [Puma yagouaroundi]